MKRRRDNVVNALICLVKKILGLNSLAHSEYKLPVNFKLQKTLKKHYDSSKSLTKKL